MLAGLIFATEEADDRPETLAATLPFGGMTLLEYQARLLIAAGAGHILVAVSRVTPALLGAVNRLAKRDVAVDVVRSAEEATRKVHPLASVLMVADGLVTTDVAVLHMAGEVPDALLVTPDSDTPAAVERVDAEHCWAGLAMLSAAKLAELAEMPREYDFQSTLLRLLVQSGAHQTPLPASARRAGHGVERNAETLTSRGNAVLAALANQRVGWADRYVFTPITRFALPQLVRRSVPEWAVLATSALSSLAALAVMGLRLPAVGLGVALLAVASFSTGSLLSWLRGDDRRARLQELSIVALGAAILLLAGVDTFLTSGTATGLALAASGVASLLIAERVPVRRRTWYCSASSSLLLLTPAAIAGYMVYGLAVIAVYAAITLALAVESERQKP